MFGVSFLSPLFLAGAAAAAIPIAIHLFYRRAEPVIHFAAMRFLRLAPVEQARRRRLRELLLLALRVAAIVLLALAFGRPFLTQSADALSAPVTMVLVDTSVSMTAPGQFDRARSLAEDAIRRSPAPHAVGVVGFANTADVLAAPSQDRGAAFAAIAKLQPGAGATRYRAALARAAEAIGDRTGRLVVITDLQQSGWDAADDGAVPDRVAVEVQDVGAPRSNLAITSLRVDGTDAIALVQNFSDRPREEPIVFSVDARRITAVPVTLPPHGTMEARTSVAGRSTGIISATVHDSDGYAADNTRYAVLDPGNAPTILAITASGQVSDTFYLEKALMVAEQSGGFRFRGISGPAFSNMSSQALEGIDAIIVLGTRGVEHHGRELLGTYLKSGGGLLLTAGPDVEPQVLREALQDVVPIAMKARETPPLRFAPSDSRHPVFRLFGGGATLANVSFARAAALEAPANAEVIARYTDGTPALVEEHVPAGRVLIFASDLNNRWNDFPLQPAFVPFVHEALRYLSAARAPKTDYLVGELQGPLGARPGAAWLPGTGSTTVGHRVAVNVDPRESDPARITADAFRTGVTRLNATAARQARAQAREREENQRLWQYGLLLMAASLIAEGVVGRRLG
jgi:hypothetical protein